MLDYLIVKDAGEKWGIGPRIVTVYYVEGRIKGALNEKIRPFSRQTRR